MFYVGQKVVCVDDVFSSDGYGDECLPRKGQVYAVRWIGTEHTRPLCIRVDEITNLVRAYMIDRVRKWEPSFGAYRFRPVVSRPTDISIFTAMLTDKQREKALCRND